MSSAYSTTTSLLPASRASMADDNNNFCLPRNILRMLFRGIDEVYYIFFGRLSNLCTLNHQYGLTEKNTSEALFVIEAY
ncbi:hypothetical protein F2Q69_00012333 [Brassica cretica]|uniref:DUF3700 domain-containing protein n=1 Tax=Brassica cretica TaxID=69181 RepID=A0A8S9R497_BRACR|nr:hypothetical protein F2Q69_00012333 [Brassica cretica]